jgi:hypothetical protein
MPKMEFATSIIPSTILRALCHEEFSSCILNHSFISVWTKEYFYFTLWAIIQLYCYIFYSSNSYSFSYWGHFQLISTSFWHDPISRYFVLFYFGILRFWTHGIVFISKHSTTWTVSPGLLLLIFFRIGSQIFSWLAWTVIFLLKPTV